MKAMLTKRLILLGLSLSGLMSIPFVEPAANMLLRSASASETIACDLNADQAAQPQRYDNGLSVPPGCHVYAPLPLGDGNCCQSRPAIRSDDGPGYVHGQPVRNAIRWWRCRQPVRSAIGWVFRGRRC